MNKAQSKINTQVDIKTKTKCIVILINFAVQII